MSSPSLIASFGHSGSQAPQLMHSSVMTVDIRSPHLRYRGPRPKSSRRTHTPETFYTQISGKNRVSVSPDAFTAMLAMIGLVICVSTLLSGVIEKTGLPHVAVFLLLGAALGPSGLAVLNVGIESPALEVVATLSLALVLFTDAIGL